MAFAIYEKQINKFYAVILEDTKALTRVYILPEFGAMLYALKVQTKSGFLDLIDHYPNKLVLQKEIHQSLKGCKLSPFISQKQGEKYFQNEREYTLRSVMLDGEMVPGLLLNKIFKRVDEFCDESQAAVQLKYNYTRDDPGYPFEYRCDIRYILMPGNILQVDTTITNLDVQTIPVADGWHPYFKLGGKVDEWMLQLSASSMLELNDKCTPTGNLLSYDRFEEEQPLKDIEPTNFFLLNKSSGYASCSLRNASNNLSVHIFNGDSYPFLKLHVSPERDSMAVVSLSAPPDSFNNKIGLMQLAPGNSKTFTVYYKTNNE